MQMQAWSDAGGGGCSDPPHWPSGVGGVRENMSAAGDVEVSAPLLPSPSMNTHDAAGTANDRWAPQSTGNELAHRGSDGGSRRPHSGRAKRFRECRPPCCPHPPPAAPTPPMHNQLWRFLAVGRPRPTPLTWRRWQAAMARAAAWCTTSWWWRRGRRRRAASAPPPGRSLSSPQAGQRAAWRPRRASAPTTPATSVAAATTRPSSSARAAASAIGRRCQWGRASRQRGTPASSRSRHRFPPWPPRTRGARPPPTAATTTTGSRRFSAFLSSAARVPAPSRRHRVQRGRLPDFGRHGGQCCGVRAGGAACGTQQPRCDGGARGGTCVHLSAWRHVVPRAAPVCRGVRCPLLDRRHRQRVGLRHPARGQRQRRRQRKGGRLQLRRRPRGVRGGGLRHFISSDRVARLGARHPPASLRECASRARPPPRATSPPGADRRRPRSPAAAIVTLGAGVRRAVSRCPPRRSSPPGSGITAGGRPVLAPAAANGGASGAPAPFGADLEARPAVAAVAVAERAAAAAARPPGSATPAPKRSAAAATHHVRRALAWAPFDY